MTDHKQNPAEIYLVPDTEHGLVWSHDPAPGEGMREEDATRYVRADLVPESNAVLCERIADLTRESSGLQAQIERLSRLSQHLSFELAHDENYKTSNTFCDLQDALAATPAQCFAEVRAQAVRDFIQWGIQKVDPEFSEFADCAEHYIATALCQEAKAGTNG